MATTRISGKNLYATFAGQVLTANGRNFEVTHEVELADASAGADPYRVFIPTIKMLSSSMEILQASGAGGSAVIAALQPEALGTLIWGPEGTAAGKPKWGYEAIVKKSDMAYPYDDVAILNVGWENNGTALIHDGSTAVWP